MRKYTKKDIEERDKKYKDLVDGIDKSSISRYIHKKCSCCGEIKPCKWRGTFTFKGVPQYHAKCVNCMSEYWIERRNRWLEKNREKERAIKKRFGKNRKKWAVDYLGGSCQICGYNKCHEALTFHHKDPSRKESEVGRMLQTRSKDAVQKELDKCDLLCFNCHMELHYNEKNN